MNPRRALLPFLAVEAGTLLSGIGNGVTVVALPWLILELTGSATAAGAMAALTAVPTMLAALLSGTIVDFLGRKPVSIASDVLSLLAVAAIPLADATVGLSFGLVVALAVAGAVFDPAGMGAREAMLPEAAVHAGLRLEKANGIHEAVWGLAFLVGPGAGGLLIGWVGAATTFWATAVMFGLSILVIALVRIPGAGRPSAHERPEGFWSGTREGLAHIWADHPLRGMSLLLMAMVALYLPVEGVLLPVYFEQQDNPAGLGSVVMALSAGGIAGALAFGALSRRLGYRQVFVWSFAITAITFLPIALLPALPIIIGASLVVGAAFGPVQPTLNVVMQTRTPGRLRGRVIGVLTASQYAAGPIGYLLAGPLVDRFGVGAAMLGFWGCFVLVAGAAFWLPSLRQLDDEPHPPRPPVEDAPPPRPL